MTHISLFPAFASLLAGGAAATIAFFCHSETASERARHALTAINNWHEQH
jgi:hypothetical protein